MDRNESLTDTQKLSAEIQEFFMVREAIGRYFSIDSFHISGDTIRFTFHEMHTNFETVKKTFQDLGYHPYLRMHGRRKVCVLVRAKPRRTESNRREALTAWILFIVTFISTTFAGYLYSLQMVDEGLLSNPFLGAISFSGALLMILGSHEMGHKLTSIRNGIDATPPYFIPFPFSLIGTLGAVIKIKSPTPDDNAALALGVSGPFVGFLVSLPFLVMGLLMSPQVPGSIFETGQGTAYALGEPLLFIIARFFLVHLREGYTLYLHPIAFAAWVGLLVTSLNLLPMAQLDGGHIAHALLGHRIHDIVSRVVLAVLLVAGVMGFMAVFDIFRPELSTQIENYAWPGWLFWAIFGFIIVRRGYPRTMNQFEPLRPSAWAWGAVSLAMLVLCFIPVPIRII